jgi:hypothetical protein
MTDFLPGFEATGMAHFSPCEKYRYTLWRSLRPYTPMKLGTCVFVMLNPSTADAAKNDPTVRRCIGYASDWGYAKLLVLNAFAFRGTDPKDMLAADNPIGDDNDYWFLELLDPKKQKPPKVTQVIVAWGKDGKHRDRDLGLMQLFGDLGITPHCLGTNQDGTPRHPLYLRKDLEPTPYLGRDHHYSKK